MHAVHACGNAHATQEQAEPAPQLHSEELEPRSIDKVSRDDGARERKRRRDRVHHARPVAHAAVIRVRGVVDDVRDRSGGHADDGAGEGAEEDDEGESACDVVDGRPHGEEEQGRHEHDDEVHVQRAELVAQPAREHAPDRASPVHSGEVVEDGDVVVGGAALLCAPDGVVQRPLLEVEEDGVEAEEHEGDGGAEPVEGGELEGGRVDPATRGEPFVVVAFVEGVRGVGLGADGGEEGGH